ADAPHAVVPGVLEGRDTATTGHLEDDLRVLGNLVLGNRCAGRRVAAEVTGVGDEHLRARHGLLRAELVARDPDVDRRNLDTADRTDDLVPKVLRFLGREN